MTDPHARCRSCGAPIIWARTGDKRRMPVDADPVPDGNVQLDYRGGPVPYAIVWGPTHAWPAGTPRYRPHFASCPDAALHRKGRNA